MKLLVTNDDGIGSVFLHALIAALRDAGHELFVVAPVHEQSWTGASKTRARGVKSERCERGFGCPTWTVDGTPSDCVNIALAHLLPKRRVEGAAGPEQTTCVEGVVSGINVGFNCTLGFILASGTIAGAWEGALHGLPALAVSQDVTEETYKYLKDHGGRPDETLLATLQVSAAHAARLTAELLPATAPRSFTVHNLNFPFPCRPDAPVRRTVPAQFFVPGLFSPAADDGTHRLIWTQGQDVSPASPLSDLKCVSAGAISHTILDYRRLGHP
ncbi:MAG TPA: 5'/3'-nucleotidase SurE [Candidatus Didemnitutus sp.]|nr:5'/3'-nucleotidase SurE [Candidatus Didemnitutus sp.]